MVRYFVPYILYQVQESTIVLEQHMTLHLVDNSIEAPVTTKFYQD